MKIKKKDRKFFVGTKKNIQIKDCAEIYLRSNEQVTFIGKNKLEYDVTKKNWGFYSTPSINGRLKKFGLKCGLIKSKNNQRLFVTLVEKNKVLEFKKYLKNENLELLIWLDKYKPS